MVAIQKTTVAFLERVMLKSGNASVDACAVVGRAIATFIIELLEDPKAARDAACLGLTRMTEHVEKA
jgi:hypothetical protein